MLSSALRAGNFRSYKCTTLARNCSTLAPWYYDASLEARVPTVAERTSFTAKHVSFDAWVGNSAIHLKDDTNAQGFDLIDPGTEVTFARKFSTQGTVEAAISASQHAFPDWASTTGKARASILRRIAASIRENAQALVSLEALNVGKPVPEADWDVQDAAGCFEYMADLAETSPSEVRSQLPHVEDGMLAESTYMPLGPIAVIVPWNYPLLMAVWKVAPALAAGCTVVLKPSEYTPLTALLLGKIAAEAGLPAGVLNVVHGAGDVGAAMAGDGRFGKVAFTGSSRAGRSVMAAAAPHTTPVSLELGGKSSAIVFADSVDTEEKLAAVVEWVLFGVFWTNGQICSATSRLLIQDSVYDKVLYKLAQAVKTIKVGDAFDCQTKLGPVVNRAQYSQVTGFAQRAHEAGIRSLTESAGAVPDRGYFIPPHIFADVPADSEVWTEEIFGPVLSATRFTSCSDAVLAANATQYGLGAAVFTGDEQVWQKASSSLRAGIVWRNCSQPCYAQTPWYVFACACLASFMLTLCSACRILPSYHFLLLQGWLQRQWFRARLGSSSPSGLHGTQNAHF